MSTVEESEYGPLGPGHEMAKDPMAGIRGVMAGALIMESITFILAITVVAKVTDHNADTPVFSITVVSALAILLFVAAFMQKRSYADYLNIGLQICAVLCIFIHPAVGIMGIIFSLVWWYIYYLRKNLQERMKRGLLPGQHWPAEK